MRRTVQIGKRIVGDAHRCFVTAEIGLNHNGDIDLAKNLIEAAKLAGCDAVKFQKREPELSVPAAYRDVMRETPWGVMSYLDYRKRVEFSQEQYDLIDAYCRERGIMWTASAWDLPSLDFLEQYHPPFHKVPSAALTDTALLKQYRETGRPLVISTGMSTMQQIRTAIGVVGEDNLIITHCTSTYPCKPAELNLRMISTLRGEFACPIGYSGHEVGLQTTLAAVALGAAFVERHITLDRAMWGSDQAASVEPGGFFRLVRDIRTIEAALGDGVKTVYASEEPVMQRLRHTGPTPASAGT